ncbi:transporter [Jannaschia pagri]|uniref:Transporter n=1 Tax=Jannaschia pagri TaxID=2829797 RepID=A0ABQ4NQV3_9RHOB|nr:MULTISPECIES: AEC family transporter [unclassified Jannaschia]GIT92794.1 transporter [Jannaschia sp. AI_61]GIT96629.1 transporter [Jannaschia sp. AI_62]
MTLAFTVLTIVAPVFALAAIGFAWVRLGLDYDTDFVSRLAMNLAVPCLVFVALAQGDIDPGAAGQVTLATLVTYGAMFAAFRVVCAVLRLDLRTYWAPLVFGNTGNLGLPLALLAFGQVGLGYAVVVFSVTAILQFTLGIWLVSGGGNPLRALREPMVGATLLGALFLWRGWAVPEVALSSLDLVGQMGIPLMLLTLGVAVARMRPQGVLRMGVLSALKVVICAGLALAVGLAFGLDDTALAVMVVQFATPVAVSSYLLAVRYGADAPPVAGLVVVSTVMSVGALPLILAAFV